MAEKFRPRRIEDVIGQDTVKNMLRRSLRNKSFPQFSIMYGPSGTGKSTLAEISALSLTCENPDNGEPCLQCRTCKSNVALLDAGKNSTSIVKLNMGAIERADFKQTIKDVFTLQPAMSEYAVYVFEEIQALTKDEQNILLEYISGMPKNVFVIACTTELQRLRQELRNRAIKFPFKQIKTEDALTLLSRTCAMKGVTEPPKDMAKFLIRSTSNCPREIVNMIDFLADADSLTEETIIEFMGFVPNTLYLTFLEKCGLDSYEFCEWLESISESGYQNIVRGIRNFLIDCYGYIYGGNTQYFNTKEKHQLKEIFKDITEEIFLDALEYFDTCKYDDDVSAKYCLIAGRRILNKRTMRKDLAVSKRDASMAVIHSENETVKTAILERQRDVVNESSLDDILGSMARIKK